MKYLRNKARHKDLPLTFIQAVEDLWTSEFYGMVSVKVSFAIC